MYPQPGAPKGFTSPPMMPKMPMQAMNPQGQPQQQPPFYPQQQQMGYPPQQQQGYGAPQQPPMPAPNPMVPKMAAPVGMAAPPQGMPVQQGQQFQGQLPPGVHQPMMAGGPKLPPSVGMPKMPIGLPPPTGPATLQPKMPPVNPNMMASPQNPPFNQLNQSPPMNQPQQPQQPNNMMPMASGGAPQQFNQPNLSPPMPSPGPPQMSMPTGAPLATRAASASISLQPPKMPTPVKGPPPGLKMPFNPANRAVSMPPAQAAQMQQAMYDMQQQEQQAQAQAQAQHQQPPSQQGYPPQQQGYPPQQGMQVPQHPMQRSVSETNVPHPQQPPQQQPQQPPFMAGPPKFPPTVGMPSVPKMPPTIPNNIPLAQRPVSMPPAAAANFQQQMAEQLQQQPQHQPYSQPETAAAAPPPNMPPPAGLTGKAPPPRPTSMAPQSGGFNFAGMESSPASTPPPQMHQTPSPPMPKVPFPGGMAPTGAGPKMPSPVGMPRPSLSTGYQPNGVSQTPPPPPAEDNTHASPFDPVPASSNDSFAQSSPFDSQDATAQVPRGYSQPMPANHNNHAPPMGVLRAGSMPLPSAVKAAPLAPKIPPSFPIIPNANPNMPPVMPPGATPAPTTTSAPVSPAIPKLPPAAAVTPKLPPGIVPQMPNGANRLPAVSVSAPGMTPKLPASIPTISTPPQQPPQQQQQPDSYNQQQQSNNGYGSGSYNQYGQQQRPNDQYNQYNQQQNDQYNQYNQYTQHQQQQNSNEQQSQAPPTPAAEPPAPDQPAAPAIPFVQLDPNSALVTAPFVVDFKLETTTLELNCTPESTVLEFLSDSMLELLTYVQDDFLTMDLVAGANQETIDNFKKVADSLYVRTCVSRGQRPVLALKRGGSDIADEDDAMPVAAPGQTPGMPSIGVTSAFGGIAAAAPVAPVAAPADALAHRRSQLGVPSGGRKSVSRGSDMDRRKSTFLTGFKPTGGQGQKVVVHFYLPDQQNVDLTVNLRETISAVKNQLCQTVRERLCIDMGGMEKYVLKLPGASILNNENEPLDTLPYIHNCLLRHQDPVFIVLGKMSDQTRQIKLNNKEIGLLVGRPLSSQQSDDEITSFRQSMTRLRYFVREANAQIQQGATGDIPVHLAAAPCSAKQNGNTMIQVRLELLGDVKKTVLCAEAETADQFIAKIFQKHYAREPKAAGRSAHDFILKATGLAEYIFGGHLVHQFEYIRECIEKNKPNIDLSLIPRSEVAVAAPSAAAQQGDDGSLEDETFLLDDPTPKYDHNEIAVGKKTWSEAEVISVFDLDIPFSFRIVGVENINPASASFVAALGNTKVSAIEDAPLWLYLTAELYHGGELLDTAFTTAPIGASANPRWYEWAKSRVNLSNLPRATRVCFTVWAGKKKEVSPATDIPLCWVNMQLYDYKHELRTGLQSLAMWSDDKANPIGTTVPNSEGQNPPILYIQVQDFHLPVVFPTEDTLQLPAYNPPNTMDSYDNAALQRLWNSDPLHPLEQYDKHLLWKFREIGKTNGKALPKFINSVPKTDRFAVQEMHRLLKLWEPMQPLDALELLDAKFADPLVREYAVSRLELLSNDDVVDYLLQLVQVLKYEPYHDSALARFLLRRALTNKTIGHHFFWFLKSEIHVPEISERYGLLLEAYLRGCGPHRAQLAKQDELQQKFVHAANLIKGFKDSERLQTLRDELAKVNFPPQGVPIPLNPRIEVSGLKIDKCKYMDSKKLPLWLVFKNADPKGSDPYVIFKSGDDLRQDMLTLQLIRIMDNVWKKAGLDLKLNPYGCISTGNEVGMIEVVLNSMTSAAITRTAGGAAAAFKEDPIANWLRENNPTDSQYKQAVENFILSCAGYCVATYVLGIGDRHNDNIMCTRDGRLFHIDFGHFLGNFKKKFGVKRERAPFVFTPDFAYVMGGKDSPDFNRFVELCGRAYNLLRRHANVFINLFCMMLSTGIPELRSAEDVEYLRDAFSLDYNDAQASEKFKGLIYESLYTRATQINNAIHILAH